MGEITDADREAAKMLQIELADICGFWHDAGDTGALCRALARHRVASERHMLDTAIRYGRNTLQFEVNPQILRRPEPAARCAAPRASPA